MLSFYMVQATLQARLIAGTLALVGALVGGLTGWSIYRANADLRDHVRADSVRMHDGLQQKGMALVKSVGLVSERAIAGYDLSFLAEVVRATVGKDSEVAYAIVMDNARQVLVASDGRLVSQVLGDETALFAAQQVAVAAHEVSTVEGGVTEVVAPLWVAGKRWGVLRLGLSQVELAAHLAQTEAAGRARVRQNVLVSLSVAAALMTLGALLASLLAGVVTQPLAALVRGAEQMRAGKLDVQLATTGPAEIAMVAAAFNRMSSAIAERDEVLYRSINALDEAKNAAEESNRLKSEFLANVSHELRTPLNAIINVPGIAIRAFQKQKVWDCGQCGGTFREEGEADPAAADAPCPECGSPLTSRECYFYVGDGDETVHFLKRMEQQATHLLALVNDVLSFAKLEAGKMQLYLDEVQTQELLAEVGNTVQSLAEGKQISLHLRADASAQTMRADAVKTMQVLVNLVGNAIKFTPIGGTVDVHVTAQADAVRFVVRDTGIGIPHDKHALIFESFRQVDGSHTRHHQGSGLGLSICQKLVHLHGGTIGVDSAEGVGSTFFFTLPQGPGSAAAMQPNKVS